MMKDTYLEIVELENGEIVLRPAGEDDDKTPIATLTISDDTKDFLKDRYFELAKCMFHAGIDFVYSDDFDGLDGSDSDVYDEEFMPRILH
ncbi:hypothetical protein MGA5115_03053 [Marinomonas gallaica]|uniref:Uncharacterized protein n=1 Tax=Marinomonas gallaica TaxID=1806667 RepID=A0A1C3JUU2_9GAMM|nr:hypothetical protein [Marinomonas gallaica]SBT18892.1 hypothetical protein MGA5115_03053 [Marinomonas gallaica]SBT21847.1 hypothetical protein MGA5116_02457 [Marinomonas gallaica]